MSDEIRFRKNCLYKYTGEHIKKKKGTERTMAGELTLSALGAQQTQQANCLIQKGEVTPLTQEQKETFTDLLKRYYPQKTNDGYSTLTDKNGNPRIGKVVTTQPASLKEIFEAVISGKQIELNKPLAKVKEAQVNKFLEAIKVLGLDLKAEDIMTKDGTLNPNFKVDDKGNISFRNLKGFINGDVPTYFETKDGEWAMEKKYDLPLFKDGTLIKADNGSGKKDTGRSIDPGFAKDAEKQTIRDSVLHRNKKLRGYPI